MKTTTNKAIISAVERLSEIIEARKKLDSEEKLIKNTLKDIMAGFKVNALNAGQYLMIVSSRVRKDLDKEKVQAKLGDEYEECLKKTEYQIFEIKKV